MVCSLSVVLGCHGGIVRHIQLRSLLKHRDLFLQICATCCHRMGDARGASCLTWHVLIEFLQRPMRCATEIFPCPGTIQFVACLNRTNPIFCAALCRPCCFLDILLHFFRQWNYHNFRGFSIWIAGDVREMALMASVLVRLWPGTDVARLQDIQESTISEF